MPIRDLAYWRKEARRRQIDRETMLYNATVLPRTTDANIGAEFDRLRFEMMEINHGAEISESTRRYEERVKAGTHRAPKRKKKTAAKEK